MNCLKNWILKKYWKILGFFWKMNGYAFYKKCCNVWSFLVFNIHNEEIVFRFNWKQIQIKNTEDITANAGYPTIKYFYSKTLVLPNLDMKEKVKIEEVDETRKDFMTDTLKSIDIQTIVKSGGKRTDIHEAVFFKYEYRKPFSKRFQKVCSCRKTNPSRKTR